MFLEKEEIKFTILYTLATYATPISKEDLSSILVWDKGILEYFDLQSILSELIEDKFVEEKFHLEKTMCTLTKEGLETNALFCDRVPQSIRDRIDDAVGSMKYETLVNPSSVIAESVPVDEKKFMARLNIIDNKVPLIDLSVYIGDRKETEKIVKYFKEHSEEIYHDIITMINAK